MVVRNDGNTTLDTLKSLREQVEGPDAREHARWLDDLIAREEERLDPRLGLTRRFPRVFQPALTWLTGKAGNEAPVWKNTALSAYLVNLGTLIAAPIATTGLLLALHGIDEARGFLLRIGIFAGTLATAGAARAGSSTFLHHTSHGNFPPPAWWVRRAEKSLIRQGRNPGTARREARDSWNRTLGEFISALLLGTPYDLYRRDHQIHHSQALATWDDPDWKFLFRYGGFRPGQSVAAYWTHLFRTLVSPRFHGRFLRARLFDNFVNAETPLYRRLLAFGIYGALSALLAFAIAHGIVPILVFLVVWAAAIGPLANANALLQLLSEHRWQRVADSADKKTVLARKTRGRFVSPRLPNAAYTPLRLVQWAFWWVRVLVWHLPVERLFVWPSDLGSHDWHHRRVGSEWWPNSAYARRLDIEAGTPGWEEPYQKDVWGLREALNEVFELLANLSEYDGLDDLTGDEEAEVFRTM